MEAENASANAKLQELGATVAAQEKEVGQTKFQGLQQTIAELRGRIASVQAASGDTALLDAKLQVRAASKSPLPLTIRPAPALCATTSDDDGLGSLLLRGCHVAARHDRRPSPDPNGIVSAPCPAPQLATEEATALSELYTLGDPSTLPPVDPPSPPPRAKTELSCPSLPSPKPKMTEDEAIAALQSFASKSADLNSRIAECEAAEDYETCVQPPWCLSGQQSVGWLVGWFVGRGGVRRAGWLAEGSRRGGLRVAAAVGWLPLAGARRWPWSSRSWRRRTPSRRRSSP
eukprot:COSAG01_NODE_673_length_14340_cov_15.681483_5_plen_288_part_00